MSRPTIIQPKRVRGVRETIPSGHVLARVSPGDGPIEVVSLDKISTVQKATGIFESAGVSFMFVGLFLGGPGDILNNQYYPMAMTAQPYTLPSTSATAVAKCDVAPVTTCNLYLLNDLSAYAIGGYPNGVLATIQFTVIGGKTGSVSWVSGTPASILQNTVLYVAAAPTFNDATIQGIQLLFVGDLV